MTSIDSIFAMDSTDSPSHDLYIQYNCHGLYRQSLPRPLQTVLAMTSPDSPSHDVANNNKKQNTGKTVTEL